MALTAPRKYKDRAEKILNVMAELLDRIEKEKVEELKATTWLSERQAQIYLLNKEEDLNMQDIAEGLGLETGTVYDYWADAKDKARKSRETLELNIGRA